MKKRINNNKGYALLFVIIMGALVMTITGTLALNSINQTARVESLRKYEEAYAGADSVWNRYLFFLNNSEDFASDPNTVFNFNSL